MVGTIVIEQSAIIVWLILAIFFAIAELASVGLTSIWFAAGALVALIVSACKGPVWLQIAVFFVVSLVALIATRPLAKKYINRKFQPTNADSRIGEIITIKEKVDNRKESGMAVVHGQEWMVRAVSDDVIIEEGTLAKVVDLKGVKLIVEEYREE